MSTTIKFTIPVRSSKPPRVVRPKHAPQRGDRTARMLALACVVERAIEDGRVRDLAHAAALFGISRARMTQVMALSQLAPDLQERILGGDETIHERAVRGALRHVGWEDQRTKILPALAPRMKLSP